MKITIEPTDMVYNYPTVSVSTPSDDLTIDHLWFEVLRPALLAWGFVEQTVDGLVGGEDDADGD